MADSTPFIQPPVRGNAVSPESEIAISDAVFERLSDLSSGDTTTILTKAGCGQDVLDVIKQQDFEDFEEPLVEVLADLSEEYTRHRLACAGSDAQEIKESHELVVEAVQCVKNVDGKHGNELSKAVCILVDHEIEKKLGIGR